MKEQRFGNAQLNLTVHCPDKKKTHFLDVEIYAKRLIFQTQHQTIPAKYDPLKRAFAIQGIEASNHVMQIGSL